MLFGDFRDMMVVKGGERDVKCIDPSSKATLVSRARILPPTNLPPFPFTSSFPSSPVPVE